MTVLFRDLILVIEMVYIGWGGSLICRVFLGLSKKALDKSPVIWRHFVVCNL
jgi:hypothetical protein